MDDTTFTLEQIAGEYSNIKGSRLTVRSDGRFDWDHIYFKNLSDMPYGVTASGRLVPDAGAFAVHLDSSPHMEEAKKILPTRLYAVGTSKLIVLLNDQNVIGIINMVNGGGANSWRFNPSA